MRKYVSPLILLMFFFLVVGCSEKEVEKPLAKRCAKKDDGSVVCVPTIHDLASDPRGYDGREVIISGYLVIDRGLLSLYSDDLSYRHSLFQDNVVLLRAPESRQKEIFDKFSYSYVRMKGLFHMSKYPPFQQYEVGELEIGSVVYKLPDKSEPGNRESWEDAKIDVRDLSRQMTP